MLLSGAVAVVLAIGLVLAGWKAGKDHAIAQQASMSALIVESANAVEARTAERIARIRVRNQTINGQVREVVRENTVYRDCVLDADTVRLLDAAREGGSEPLPGDSSLSEAGAGPAP